MKTTKAYLLVYFEFGQIPREDYWEKPFLVVKDLEIAKNEVARLEKWIEDTRKTIPVNEFCEQDDGYYGRSEEINSFIEKIKYPYEVLRYCLYGDESNFRIDEIEVFSENL